MSTTTRITIEQYHEMIRQGAFEPRELHYIELIDGEITTMCSVGPPHSWYVSELDDWSHDILGRDVIKVRTEQPVDIAELDSEPQPDIVWAKRFRYKDRHPLPSEIFLIIEVSDSSLSKDQGIKCKLYARAGISDYWIVNVSEQCIEVRRDPAGDAYRALEIYRPGQEVRPLAFPDAVLPVAMLFEA